MTRLVPRPDWTPEDVAAAIWAVASSLSDQRYLQLNTPDRIEAFARLPAVLALFRPAEEPGIVTATADHARPLEPIPWDDDYPRETPAPVAPPPAGEPAWMTSELRKNLDCMVFVDAQVFSQARGNMSQVFSQARASMVAAIDHAVLSALAALRAENERLTGAIRWALGEGDSDFGDQLPPGRHPGDGQKPRIPPYWWRTHLRQKAGLVPPGENRSEG